MNSESTTGRNRRAEILAILTTTFLLILVVLSIGWELWLAPLRPGGSWLVLKALPLLAPLRGLLHGRRHTFQWSAMLILAYMAEGIVRVVTEQGISRTLAGIECTLALLIFVLSISYVRITRPSKNERHSEGSS